MSQPTRIGTEIAGYRLESVIGRGGMSVIYLAEQVRLGRKVALKLLAPELAEDDRFRDRFLRESRLASTFEHPNIIPIHDAGEENGLLYIVMRYINGPSLKELIRRQGPLSVGRTIYIVEQIASALDVAHSHALVHRDVKPANILIEESSDHAFLSDFGVAKQTTARGMTSTGLFLGTIEYSSPEQIEGRPVDGRTDVYGLGCVLVEGLTAAPPFDQETEVALIHAHLSAPPPMVTARRPDLPLGLNGVVSRALAKAPEERYQTAGELAVAFREAALRSSTAARTAGSTFTAASSPPRSEVSAEHPAEPAVPVPAGEPAWAAVDPGPPPEVVAPAAVASGPAAPDPGPPGDAPPVDPPPPAARARAGTGGGRRSAIIAAAVVGALAVAALSAGAAVLLTRGGSSGESAGATTGGTGTGTALGATHGAAMADSSGSSMHDTAGTDLQAPLSSSAEVPKSISTTSSGTADVTIDGTKVCWTFHLNGVVNPTAAHIHRGGSTVSGPVLVPLGASFKPSGCTTAPRAATVAILRNPGAYYVNVHSQTYPDGAVRGQLESGSGPTGGHMAMGGTEKGSPRQQLQEFIGMQTTWTCSTAAPRHRATETMVCATKVPDRLAISIFATKRALLAAYDQVLRAQHGPAHGAGACSATSWRGEERWFHGEREPGGRVFCYLDTTRGASHLVWTSNLGVPTLYDARYPNLDHRNLYFWWANFKHDIF